MDFIPDHQALVLEDAENDEEWLKELKKLKSTMEERFDAIEVSSLTQAILNVV